MTTSSVEFRLVNNITVTIPVSSVPLLQQSHSAQAYHLPDAENAQEALKESQETPNISTYYSFDTRKENSNCDIKEYPEIFNIPREHCHSEVFQAEEPIAQQKKKLSKKSKARTKTEIRTIYQCKECLDTFPLISELHLHALKNHWKNSQKLHKCYFCPGSFDEKSLLDRHIFLHESSEVFECPDCSSVFVELRLFLEHMDNHELLKNQPNLEEQSLLENLRTEEEGGPAAISDCDEVPLHSPDVHETEEIEQGQSIESPKIVKTRRIVDIQGTLEWQRRDNKNRPFTCNICNRSFTLASTLSLHTRRTHLGIRPYECAECGWKFGQSSDLTKHMRKHTGDRPYKCETCGLSFSQLRNLKNHSKMHVEEPSKCKYCGKMFAIVTSLQVHMKKHEGPEAEPCEACGIPFTEAKDLELHRRRHHRESKPHKCSECQKSFSKKCDMIKHQRIHTGEKLFVCSICQKSFTHPTSLRNHAAVHSGEKPFQCSACGRAFGFAGNLKVHMRSHTGEKPYQCNTCGKFFSRTANLNEHVKIHTGEKSYRCDACGKAFTNSSTFSKHKKIHLGVRPHTCNLCSKTFIQYAHLAKHLRIHTGEKPYQCSICGKFFRRTDTLSSHMKTHRKVENPKDIPPETIHFTFTTAGDEIAGQIPLTHYTESQEGHFDTMGQSNPPILITHL